MSLIFLKWRKGVIERISNGIDGIRKQKQLHGIRSSRIQNQSFLRLFRNFMREEEILS